MLTKTSLSHHGFSFIRPGEIYPLMLSVGILIQSTTFAVAQSTGMEQFFTTGCTLLSQVMLPGKCPQGSWRIE
jgi:hypothetical protein